MQLRLICECGCLTLSVMSFPFEEFSKLNLAVVRVREVLGVQVITAFGFVEPGHGWTSSELHVLWRSRRD